MARTPVFYSPAYVVSGHVFETTRKAAWVAASLAADPIEGVVIEAPRSLTAADLEAVHDPAYIAAVRSGEPRVLAESQGFLWDAALWDAVRASSGGAVAAALDALARRGIAGSLSSGLHHARAARGDGSCTFNGLALAARAALDAGAGAVLIVDLDAHFGGGTHELLAGDERVFHLDVSVDAYDVYPAEARWWTSFVDRAEDYLPAIESGFASLSNTPRFDLCIYNAGMDPHRDCPEGGLAGLTTAMLAAREAFVFDWCRARGVPVAFVLAGGYLGPDLDEPALVALHRLTLAAAATRA
ncbi:Deacetylase [Minicystis rosea]|nr:Deacetylase [Minicystis rosea]